jgi:hypothetical protein
VAVNARFSADFSSFQQAVQKAELSLKSFETGAGKVEKSLNKMGDSFSGVKIIQEANLLAKAIGGVEGAAKLTEAEQKKVNATLTEALAKYKALGLEAPAHLKNLAQATAEVQQKTSLADKAAGLLKSSFGQFTAANLAVNAISALTDKVSEFASKGAQLRGLESSFSNLTGTIKQDSGAMLAALQTGTRGLVANFDLLTSANKAMLLGLPVTVDTMGELAKTATTLGRAMGQDATKSLDDLITALGRSSPLILDNLGLTVKVGEANEAYAKKLGISVEAMTEAQKKLAFYEAAMDAARVKTKELGDQTLTLSERISQVWVGIENAVTKGASNMNVVLGKATESWGDFFRFLKDSAAFKSWEEQAKKLEKPRQVGLPVIDPGALARESKAFQDEMKAVEKAFEDSQQKAKAYAQEIAGLRNEISGKGTVKAAQDLLKAIRGLTDVNGQALPVWRLTRQEQDRINGAMEDAIKVYRMQGVEAPAAIRQIAAATADLLKLAPAVKEGIPKGFEEIGKQAKLASAEVMAYLAAIEAAATVQSKVKLGIDSVPGFHVDPKELGIDFGKKAGKSAGEQFGKELSQAIIGAIQGGGSVSQAIGATVGQSIGEMAGKSIAKGIGGKFGEILGGMLGPLGTIGGQLVGGLFDKLFGKSQSRKAAEAFAETFGGFDTLQKKLETLPKHADTFWRALTQGGGNSKAAIEAITEAFRLQEEAMNTTTPSYADASAAAEKLGLDITKIGDAMNQLRVHDAAADIAASWQTLEDAGANMNEVAVGAAGKFQEMVDEALNWGHKLPESMREPLKKMVEMGLLTDGTGEKLEDLSSIKFSKPLEQAMDDLIAKLDQLIDKIGGVGGALNGIPRNVEVNVNTTRSGEGYESFASGSGGFRNFGSGTPAMLHGWEAVVRPQDLAGAGNITIPIYLGGQQLDTVVVDALNRTYRLRNSVGAA